MAKRFRPPDSKPLRIRPEVAKAAQRVRFDIATEIADRDIRSQVMVRLVRAAQRAPLEAMHSALNYLRDWE